MQNEIKRRLEKAIELIKSGETLSLRNCSFCRYSLRYFYDYLKGIHFDAGCDCVKYSGIRKASDAELLNLVAQDSIASKWGLLEGQKNANT
jgi:hypothetical protein